MALVPLLLIASAAQAQSALIADRLTPGHNRTVVIPCDTTRFDYAFLEDFVYGRMPIGKYDRDSKANRIRLNDEMSQWMQACQYEVLAARYGRKALRDRGPSGNLVIKVITGAAEFTLNRTRTVGLSKKTSSHRTIFMAPFLHTVGLDYFKTRTSFSFKIVHIT